MKTRTTYICEKCGRAFKSAEECEEHEKTHMKPTGEVFTLRYPKDSETPDKIKVYFKNDKDEEVGLEFYAWR